MGLIKRRVRKREMLEFSLNITSLMDVLTVLLFFLLKSFSVSSSAITTPDGIHLPSSVVKAQIEETVNIALSATELRAGDKILSKLSAGRFPASDFAQDQRTLLSLKSYLDDQMKRRNQVYKAAASDDGEAPTSAELPPGKILIQSDKDLPFATLKHLLHTAAASGYGDYQFVVKNPEE